MRASLAIRGLGPLLLAALGSAALAGESFQGKVIHVADGDTITVLRDGTPVKVRLHGVDAPEKSQPYGDRAKEFTHALVLGREVRVEALAKDRYGRTVGRVTVTRVESVDHYEDGTHAPVDITRCLNEELVKAGLAWWYRKYAASDQKIAALEAEARKAGRGLWADPHPTPPWDYRHPAPHLVCEKDADCTFLPSVCPECAPCAPARRPLGNRKALEEIRTRQAAVRCKMAPCPPCASEALWIEGTLACEEGRCVLAKPGPDPSSEAPLRGNTKSKVFHSTACRDHACKSCLVGFKTALEARRAGYRPHSCVAPFEKCTADCLKRSQQKAVAWGAIEAGCRRSCARGGGLSNGP
jgi:micrococcal nuclease